MRAIGWILVVVALLVTIVDLIFYIRNGGSLLRSAGMWWFNAHADSLQLAQAAIQRYVLPALWDPVIQTVLTWPLALISLVLGLVFLLLTRRRRRNKQLFP